MIIAQAVAAIAVGLPYPAATPGQAFIAGPRQLGIEGLAFVQYAGPGYWLVNDKGYVVREFSKDATAESVAEWLGGASLPSGYVVLDPRRTVVSLPALPALRSWMDVVAMGMRFASPRREAATSDEEGLLVMFLSSYGPADHLYTERINSLAGEAVRASIKVIALFPGKSETKATVARFATLHQFQFGCAIDAGNAYADAYRATRTPEVFLLDKSMRVVYTGAIDDSTFGGAAARPYLRNAITDLTNRRDPRTKFTRVFGTPIDR